MAIKWEELTKKEREIIIKEYKSWWDWKELCDWAYNNYVNSNKFKEDKKVKMVDYQQELKRLQEGSNYWKPKAGQFKVKALTELEKTDPYIRKTKDQEGNEVTETHEQAKIKILIDNTEKIWTFGIGNTQASTYGQLVDLATKRENKLKDVEFTVVVKFDGTKNSYTIVE